MIKVHLQFRSYDHIAQTLVKPAIAEALILTASLIVLSQHGHKLGALSRILRIIGPLRG